MPPLRAMTARTYSSASYAANDVPVPFDIDGTEFKAWPQRCPASVVLDFNLSELSDTTNPTRDFFAAVIEDYDGFAAFLREHKIPAAMLTDIAKDLLEETTGRPTQPSKP